MYKISFCQTCKNRLYQLKQTIFQNLEYIKKDENSELVLIDYNDNQGLEEFIKENFIEEIRAGHLIYLQEKESIYFEMSKAKNLAHFGANGEFLFNLDSDNFIGDIISTLRKMWNQYPKALIHNFNRFNKDDGSYGRMGISKQTFSKLGGFDENLTGAWYEDIDFCKRALKIGCEYISLTSNTNKIHCLQHTDTERIKNTRFSHLTMQDLHKINKEKSEELLKQNIIIRNKERKRVKIIKNFNEEIYV